MNLERILQLLISPRANGFPILIAAIGAFSMYLGYDLFQSGVTEGGAALKVSLGTSRTFEMGKGGPGLVFSAFGMGIILYSIFKFSSLRVDSFEAYVNEANIAEAIQSGDIVFLCVDNHKTRMIVNNYCQQLQDVTLISGGNEFEDGNVQIYVRKGGQDVTPDLCAYHPEIANPDDKLPEEMGCEELAQSDPQLYFANLYVATLMCCAFYNVVVKESYERSEVYFDITTMSADAKTRIVKTE